MLSLSLTRRNASTLVAGLALAFAGPDTLRSALASTAGLLLEALPLLVGAHALAAGLRAFECRGGASPRVFSAWLLGLAGCGCGSLPGALSLPAAGLAWYTFGPAAALARFIAGCVVARLTRADDSVHTVEPLDQVASLVPFAAAGALASEALRVLQPHLTDWPAAQFAAGAALGLFSACSLGSLAVAVSVHAAAPHLAWGIVATAGVLPLGGRASFRSLAADARIGYGALAAAGLAVVLMGGAGLVHPRLAVPVVVAAAAATVFAARKTARKGSLLAPAVVAAALIVGTRVPNATVADALAPDAFAGQAVQFTGLVRHRGADELLVRFVMTCCRADARPVALRLDRPTHLRDGTWATVEGVFRQSPRGLVVRVARVARAATPADPFIYR